MAEPYEPVSAQDLTEFEVQARDVARITKAQHDAFLEAGFSAQQALLLTRTWLSTTYGRDQ